MHDTSCDDRRALRPDRVQMLRVLVIEDDPGDYEAVVRALGRMKCFEALITRAKDLGAARKLMREHDFDVVLVDFDLGAECGTRFIDEIGGRGARSVAILLTGLATREVQEAALQSGAISIIAKGDLSASVLEHTIRYSLYTHHIEAVASGVLHSLLARDRTQTS